eukprot:GHUV01053115.1.p1 GENE.GHUV01053115.1~~GHUV01053115.1.p1  ORF type:complete len:173 (-),score=22.65 GHUV01053115.1:84-602(-)
MTSNNLAIREASGLSCQAAAYQLSQHTAQRTAQHCISWAPGWNFPASDMLSCCNSRKHSEPGDDCTASPHRDTMALFILCMQIWRVPDCPAVYQQLLPAFDQLPQHFQSATNYHFGIHAAHPPIALIEAVRQAAKTTGGGKHVISQVHLGLQWATLFLCVYAVCSMYCTRTS